MFFNVDTAPSFMVDIASPSDSFNVTLSDPQNQIITPENVADFNGEYIFDEIQNTGSFIGVPTLLSGFHYMYSIQNPIAGNWKIIISGKNLPADGEIALVQIFMQNNLKVGLITNKTQYIVNSPVLILMSVFDGSVPISGASAIANIKNLTNGDENIITLKDDGSETDNLAGDGLYSGVYIPSNPGDYAIMAEINGNTISGISFNKDAFSSFSVRSAIARFNDILSDQGVDNDNDGLFEYITIISGVDIDVAGTYRISTTLKGSNDNTKTVIVLQELNQGSGQTVNINFSKEDIFEIGVDGPYTVSEITIEILETGCHLKKL